MLQHISDSTAGDCVLGRVCGRSTSTTNFPDCVNRYLTREYLVAYQNSKILLMQPSVVQLLKETKDPRTAEVSQVSSWPNMAYCSIE